MKKFKFILIAFSIFLFTGLNSCEGPYEVKPIQKPSTGTLKLRLETNINGSNVVLNSIKYLNEHLDTFKVSRLRYYISNIRLKKSDGSYYKVPESYYLIDASVSTDTSILIHSVYIGNYIQAEISIGVDATRNHTGAQTGALDPTFADDMYWSWSAGYKFVILEGSYNTTSSNGFSPLVFQIGDDVNYKTSTFNSGNTTWSDINIRTGQISEIHLKANFDEMFKTPNTINFDLTNNVAGGPDANTIADNYADMLSLAGIMNQ